MKREQETPISPPRGLVKNHLHIAYQTLLGKANRGSAKAMLQIGDVHAGGIGRTVNYHEAFRWFEKSARLGNIMAKYNLALVQLGCMYLGEGVPRNEERAFMWFTKAAKQEHSVVQEKLGMCYFHGIGTEKDQTRGIYWWVRGADNGSEDCAEYLSELNEVL